MRITHFLFLLLFIVNSCSAQVVDKVLLEQKEIIPLIDSLSNTSLVKFENDKYEWQNNLKYINDLSVSEITYLSDGLKINGYLIKPKEKGKYPCVIWNRGGVKNYGEINLVRASAMLGKLASAGYIVIASQYRGNGGSEGQEEYGGAEINDVLNLINVLAEIPEADTSRIGMFGGSRGGMMTYIALSKTNKLKAAVVLAAPSDQHQSIKDRPSLENSLLELAPGYEQNKQMELDRRSAVKWVHKFPKDAPILIMHGNADWRVNSSQSLRLALKFDEARIPYRLLIFEGADHGISEFRKEYYSNMINWFDKYLKNGRRLPDMTYHGK